MTPSIRALRGLAACVALSLLAAVAQAQVAPVAPGCSDFPCGRIESIRQVMVKDTWTPLGTTGTMGAGSRSGAVAAYEIGPGLSNKGMVLLGSSGGANYRKSPNSYEKPQWEVTVKQDDGRKRVLTLAYEPYLREGDRVRVAGNQIESVD
jgi:outer membrane lipoprotein SlyB